MSLRRWFACFGVAAAAATLFVACGDDDDDDATRAATTGTIAAGTTASGGGDATVTVADNSFSPAKVTIAVNHEVTWQWTGSNPHSVIGRFEGTDVQSPRLTGTGTFSFSFPKAGTFEYQCGVHGAAMSGTVTVQ